MKLFTAGRGPVLYLLDDGETAAHLWEALPHNYSLISLEGADWERDYTPWPAPALKSGEKDFSGGGKAYLAGLLASLSSLEAELDYAPPARGILGYSLAGLFALYALLESDAFSLAASVSGSLWYDGWSAYLQGRSAAGKRVYLSLGSREAKSGSLRMRTVAENTVLTEAFFRGGGVETLYEQNPGGHFSDPEGRILKAIRWLCR